MAAIATIRGTAIAPGVSRNKRLYTSEMLGRAVQRANERIAAGGDPLTMLTHHGAQDDSTRIVGRVTKLAQQDDGRVTFEAEIADTQHGRDIAALVTGDQPFLDGVSIRGAWKGNIRRVQHDGQTVETADELELHGLDFTKTPGVPSARIEPGADPAEAASEGLVYESVTEATAAKKTKPYGDVQYADPGYQADKVKRYPLDTEKHARAAWGYINQADNARLYSAQQLKRIRSRIKAALKRFGVNVASESTQLSDVTEFYGDMSASGQAGGFCIDAYNGPISLTLRCSGIDPAELRAIASAAMNAAVDALHAMDPDMDGDIDVPGAPHADTDGDDGEEAADRTDDDEMETAQPVYVTSGEPITQEHWDLVRRAGIPTPPGTAVTAAMVNQALAALASTAPAVPVGETTTPQEVPAVSEQPTNAAVAEAAITQQAAPVYQLTQEQFAALLAGRAPVAETAPVAPAAPAPAAPAAPVAETEDERIARIVEQRLAVEREQMVTGLREAVRQEGPARKGMSRQTPGSVTEAAQAGDPAAQRQAFNDALVDWVSNGRYSNYSG